MCLLHHFQGCSYFEKLDSLCSKANTDVEVPFSSAFIAQALHKVLPKESIMQFSILNSLRVWNLFQLDPTIECYSNVGAFGIDGGLSTLVGQSVATDKLSYMIIGDLAFYYDMNSIGIRHIKNNLRIIMINNNGDIEFKQNTNDHSEVDRFTAAANHFKNAKGWSETCRFQYIGVNSKEEFLDNREYLIKESEKPIFMEIFVSDNDDYIGYKSIINANRVLTISYLVKKGLSKL